MIRVAGHPIANDFRQDRRVALRRVLQRFQNEDTGAFADDKSIAAASNGRLALPGSSLRVESARIEANPPMPIGVIVASVPPQIIISAAPRSIILKESPIA